MVGGGRYDALVVGAGPAGSVAALRLARAGARVALVDRAGFPRDKACGDLVGPRGLQVLADLGIRPPEGLAVGDMDVLGPTGRRVRLPAVAGASYPGRALAVRRLVLDAALRELALEAGAEGVLGRAGTARFDRGRLEGFRCGAHELRADLVVGADGSCSRVAEVAGLVEPARVLWGFAVRWYVEEAVERPVIAWWEPAPGRPLPGYGWLFPGPGGVANLGLGVGVRAARGRGAAAVRAAEGFAAHLHRAGLLRRRIAPRPAAGGRRLGGWLKMGMVGTVPARGNVLLVGDAAGLVNPLQGEGIAPALASGADAAAAVLAGPAGAAERYRAALVARHGRYLPVGATAQRALLSHPLGLAVLARALTAPGLGRAVAGGWALSWNDLLEGAPAGTARGVARAALATGRLVTAFSGDRRWFAELERLEA